MRSFAFLRMSASTLLCWLYCGASLYGAVLIEPTTSDTPHMSFSFVRNLGQADSKVRYMGIGSQFSAWFEDRDVLLKRGETLVKINFENRPRSAVDRPAPRITASGATAA